MSAEGLEQVSVESSDGRVLTGVGVTTEALQETIDARTPDTAKTPPPVAGDAAPVPVEPKPTRGQKRFDQLTGEREAEKRAREAAEKERDELKAQLAAAKQPPADPKPRELEPEPKAPVLTRNKPVEDEIGTKYQSYADFVEDLADWKAEQRLAALDLDARVRSSIEADRASRSFADSVEDIKTRGRKVYANFDAVLATGAGVPIALGPDTATDTARVKAILGLPNAEHLIYAIANDADLAKTLGSLSDVAFGLKLAQIAPASPVASPASTGTPGSLPPQPYQPVGSGSVTTVPSSAELTRKAGFDFDRSGYREKRAAERGVRRP